MNSKAVVIEDTLTCFQVILASGNDGNPFQTTPTSVRGNIINQTDASNNSLGYFRLSEVDTKEYTIQ